MRIVTILFAILISLCSFAQKEKVFSLKSVRGEYSDVLEYSDVTGREATQLAREATKRKALEEVCGIRVNIWDKMEISSVGDVFNSLSINQIDGEIVDFEVIEEGHRQSSTRSSETIFYCIANVKVKKGIEPDPNFCVTVNGLKNVYSVGEYMRFSVRPQMDCYMKVFLLEDEKYGTILFPNEFEPSEIIPADKEFKFPSVPYYDLPCQLNSNKSKEVHRLVFVFTKTERSFNEKETSRAEIEKWIAKIPNNQKFLHFAIIEIRDI